MSLQLIKDSKGNNTGVFIPIKVWNVISRDNESLLKMISTEEDSISENFVISEKQKSQLDESSEAQKERFLTLTQLKEKIENKYGVSL